MAGASRCEHANATAPTCAYKIGDTEEYEKYWGGEDMGPNSTFPVAMGEIAEPQENRECTMVTDPLNNGGQLSTNEEQDKFPITGRIQTLSTPEGNPTCLGFDSEGNEGISDVYPIQPVKTLRSVAAFSGKIKTKEHIPHATNVQQSCELSDGRRPSGQVKASSSPGQRVQSTHTIDCNATRLSLSRDNRKLSPPGEVVNFNNSLKGESSFVNTPRPPRKTGKVVNQVGAMEYSRPKTTPVKRCFNTLQKIKCYMCGL